jgi:hypothetical protein
MPSQVSQKDFFNAAFTWPDQVFSLPCHGLIDINLNIVMVIQILECFCWVDELKMQF